MYKNNLSPGWPQAVPHKSRQQWELSTTTTTIQASLLHLLTRKVTLSRKEEEEKVNVCKLRLQSWNCKKHMQHRLSNEWLKTSHGYGHGVRNCYPSIWEAITSDMYISINFVSFFIYDGRISYGLLIFCLSQSF